jgi:hypothetical protein
MVRFRNRLVHLDSHQSLSNRICREGFVAGGKSNYPYSEILVVLTCRASMPDKATPAKTEVSLLRIFR